MDDELKSYWDWFTEKTEERRKLIEEEAKLEHERLKLNWGWQYCEYEDRCGKDCKEYQYLPRTLSDKGKELDSELRDKLCDIREKIKNYL